MSFFSSLSDDVNGDIKSTKSSSVCVCDTLRFFLVHHAPGGPAAGTVLQEQNAGGVPEGTDQGACEGAGHGSGVRSSTSRDACCAISDQCQRSDVLHSHRIESNDLPLLAAIASTHSPYVAQILL